MSKRKDATIWKCIRNATIAAAIGIGATALITPAFAATYHQGDKLVIANQGSGILDLTFSAPFATPCGDGDWSGCGYQAGGQIIVTADPDDCGGWCGESAGSFNLSAYSPVQIVSIDMNYWSSKWFVLHFTGQNHVAVDWPVAETPAPVPLPAAGVFLLAGLGALAVVRRRGKS